MNDCCSEQALTVLVTQRIPERALSGSPLQITLMVTSNRVKPTQEERRKLWQRQATRPAFDPLVSMKLGPQAEGIRGAKDPPLGVTITFGRSRKWCATCTRRKTYWLVEYGPFCKHTVCWECMGPRVRAAFRAGY